MQDELGVEGHDVLCLQRLVLFPRQLSGKGSFQPGIGCDVNYHISEPSQSKVEKIPKSGDL